jgi:hypothetical protein
MQSGNCAIRLMVRLINYVLPLPHRRCAEKTPCVVNQSTNQSRKALQADAQYHAIDVTQSIETFLIEVMVFLIEVGEK